MKKLDSFLDLVVIARVCLLRECMLRYILMVCVLVHVFLYFSEVVYLKIYR